MPETTGSCVTHHHACDCREAAHAAEVAEWRQRAVDAEEMLRDMRRGWLKVIQQENSCPATGGGCFAARCGCVAEMEMLMREDAGDA
jgi:hypothetical protein